MKLAMPGGEFAGFADGIRADAQATSMPPPVGSALATTASTSSPPTVSGSDRSCSPRSARTSASAGPSATACSWRPASRCTLLISTPAGALRVRSAVRHRMALSSHQPFCAVFQHGQPAAIPINARASQMGESNSSTQPSTCLSSPDSICSRMISRRTSERVLVIDGVSDARVSSAPEKSPALARIVAISSTSSSLSKGLGRSRRKLSLPMVCLASCSVTTTRNGSDFLRK